MNRTCLQCGTLDGSLHLAGCTQRSTIVITNTPRAGESAAATAARTAPRSRPPALQTQVGGAHYTDMPIQPIEYILANGIPFPEGNVIKYVSRWRAKGGVKDLEKAKHHLELLIENEQRKDLNNV